MSAPKGEALLQGSALNAHFGGAEGNVAVALARLGRDSAMVSVVPDDAIGDAAIDALRKSGVDVSGILRAPGRLGLYFLTPAAGARGASIIYDRSNSVFTSARPDLFDWPRLLAGAAWLHLSGIIPAMGPEMAELGMTAIAAARDAGVRISFDGNYRASMWARWCPNPGAILSDYLAGADVLFGGHRDLSLILGQDLRGDTDEDQRRAAMAAFDLFPDLDLIASTSRTIVSPDHHRLSARIDKRKEFFAAPPVDLFDIADRIGTGDAFAAGVLSRIDEGCAEAVNAGLALAALKHGTTGDHSVATPRDLAAFGPEPEDVRR